MSKRETLRESPELCGSTCIASLNGQRLMQPYVGDSRTCAATRCWLRHLAHQIRLSLLRTPLQNGTFAKTVSKIVVVIVFCHLTSSQTAGCVALIPLQHLIRRLKSSFRLMNGPIRSSATSTSYTAASARIAILGFKRPSIITFHPFADQVPIRTQWSIV